MTHANRTQLRWKALTLQTQLRVVLAGLVLAISTIIFGSIYFSVKAALLEQGFNLLAISNQRAFERVEQASNAFNESQAQSLQLYEQILIDRRHIGNTGENYLIASDGTLLTPSRFLTNPGLAQLPHFEKTWHGILNDYRGIPVLSVLNRFEVHGHLMVLASEIDLQEILQPLYHTLKIVAVFGAVAFFGVLILAHFLQKLFFSNIEYSRHLERTRKIALIDGQESERQRISMDLHDDLAPRIAALSWKVKSSARASGEPDDLQAEFQDIIKLLRTLNSELSISILRDYGFEAACRSLLERVTEHAILKNIQFSFVIHSPDSEICARNLTREASLYRILQEACHNMLKHSSAQNANCEIDLTNPLQTRICIQDDGIGLTMSPSNLPQGMGLTNIKTRLEAFQGELDIISAPGQGFQMTVRCPSEVNAI